jgi:hypothetical protein
MGRGVVFCWNWGFLGLFRHEDNIFKPRLLRKQALAMVEAGYPFSWSDE